MLLARRNYFSRTGLHGYWLLHSLQPCPELPGNMCLVSSCCFTVFLSGKQSSCTGLRYKDSAMNKLVYPAGWLFLFLLLAGNTAGQITERSLIINPQQVSRFYEQTGDSLFWFASGNRYMEKRKELKDILDTSFYYGLIARRYHGGELDQYMETYESDTVMRRQQDHLFTDAAIALYKDLQLGYAQSPWLGYDPVTEKLAQAEYTDLLNALSYARTAPQLEQLMTKLEPADPPYRLLRQELIRQVRMNHRDTVQRLLLSMNYYRRIHHFPFNQVIVVNLAAARLSYYESGKQVLNMKIVAGKYSTPTPRFSAWCDQAILYPYWYVPRSIVFNEYLPLIKKNPGWLDAKNMQVTDASGKVLNPYALNWASFHSGYFPYTIRQSTGCDNALGVIKFNINTPYGVYLHDTNNKSAFFSASRYYSHGCIRLEEPFKLGYHLLGHELDTAFLQSCFKKQAPVYERIKTPVPVFVVYMPVEAGSTGKLIYYKDVYRLLK